VVMSPKRMKRKKEKVVGRLQMLEASNVAMTMKRLSNLDICGRKENDARFANLASRLGHLTIEIAHDASFYSPGRSDGLSCGLHIWPTTRPKLNTNCYVFLSLGMFIRARRCHSNGTIIRSVSCLPLGRTICKLKASVTSRNG
jgi:hypothetical protein